MTEPAASRRPSTPELICAGGLAVSLVAPLVLLAATAWLLAHHVILLEVLSSSAVSIVTGGAMAKVGTAPFALVLLAPLAGLLLTDVFYWWAGRLWGDRVAQLMTARQPRYARWVERVDDWVARHGIAVLSVAYFLPVPNPLVYASCGAGGMPLVLFLIGDALGTLLWSGLLVGLGWQLGQGAVDVVHAVNHYALLVTIAVVVVLVVVRRRRQ